MSFIKYAAAAAALAGSAMAQCSASTTTIRNPGDASGLGSCQTFSGAVAIATDASGSLDFGSLGAIRGDFIGSAPNVNSIQANSIQSMGAFTLRNMTQLYTLSMQQLRTVDSIEWDTIGSLQTPNFGTGLQTVNQGIRVQNTGIQDLSGLNIKQIMGDCLIQNNNQLSGLTWSTTNVSSLTISANGPQQLNLSLANLQTVGKDLDVSNVADINVQSLSTVGNLFSVRSSNAQSLMLPNLTQAAAVQVSDNRNLENVSFPMLNATMPGSLKLVNNDKLGGDIKFPALVNIRGDLNITGAWSSVTMPKINTIGSTVYLWSTEDISKTCDQFGQYVSRGVVRGKLSQQQAGGTQLSNGIVCHGKSMTATDNGRAGTSTSGGSSSSSSSSAAQANWVATPGALFGATGLVAAMLGMI